MSSLKDILEADGVSFDDMMDENPEAIIRALAGDSTYLNGAVEGVSVSPDVQQAAQAKGNLFCIWAEENGGMNANAYEWSWGNGAVGNDIGIPVAVNCELVSVSFNADEAGTSINIETERNGTAIFTSTHSNNDVVDLPSPVSFGKSDRVSFRTGAITGAYTDSRVCAWFREV